MKLIISFLVILIAVLIFLAIIIIAVSISPTYTSFLVGCFIGGFSAITYAMALIKGIWR